MSTAKKAICKTLATRKGLPGLDELCTKQLWVQSIKAGKAKQLVKTLETVSYTHLTLPTTPYV